MDNAQVARTLAEIADITELLGGNQFRVRAYRQAAQVVDLLPGPVSDYWREGKLVELPGIGKKIAGHIGELIESGACEEHEGLKSQIPMEILELLRLEGVGPKTVVALWHSLGITNLEALEKACHDGSILQLERMGKKRAESILKAIERHRARRGRIPLYRVLPYAENIVEQLRRLPNVTQAEVAGSLRRRRETIGDIDFLAASEDPESTVHAFTQLPDIVAVRAEGPAKASVRLAFGIDADLRVVSPDSFGAALHYFTGSKAHNIAIRSRAVRQGLKLNEYGIFDREGERRGGEEEREVFAAVGLPPICPELREGTGELEAAEANRLPKLVELSDLRGDLHIHSKASSDAHSSIEDIAKEARKLGHEYIAITDHSRSRPLGLTEAGLRRQIDEIRALNRKLRGRPHLLTGIEVDILSDGSLDLPIALLETLDCVVASVHSHFNQSREAMTERIVRALATGVVHVLGHPTGRQLGARDAYEFDFDEVFDAARRFEVALEINSMPERLDLNDKAARLAKDRGVMLAISSDAHHLSQMHNLHYGLWMARRGWIEAGDVLNTLSYAKLMKRLRRKRGRQSRQPFVELSP